MSRMSDQPLTLGNLATALAQFHRDIVRPDIVQIVNDAVTDSERRAQVNFDAIFHKLDKIETEYQALKAGLERVEAAVELTNGRVGALEAQYADLLNAVNRLDERLNRLEERDPLRAEIAELRARVDGLHAQMRSLEERVAGEG